MKVIWRSGPPQGGVARWALFGIVAAVIGLGVLILVALGLAVGAALVGIFSVGAAWLSRRRAGYAGRTVPDGCEAQGTCVELDRDSYTVRIVEENKP